MVLRDSMTLGELVNIFIPSETGKEQELTNLGFPTISTTQSRQAPEGIKSFI